MIRAPAEVTTVRLLHPVVAALVRDVLDPGGEVELDEDALVEAVGNMVGLVRGMPRHLAIGMTALTVMMDKATLPVCGHRYHRLSPAARVRVLSALRRSPVGPLRDLVDFYEKMGTFTYYSAIERRGGHA